MMPPPKSAQPRRLLLSWRPGESQASDTNRFLKLFKQQMKFQCRDSIEVVDMLEPGTQKAAQREGPWTEFLAVLTMDYLEACESEPDHELPAVVLHELETGQEGKRYWSVRIESWDPEGITLVANDRKYHPWADHACWHLIPSRSAGHEDGPADDFIDTHRNDLGTTVDIKCVRRLKAHQVACEVCGVPSPPSKQP